MFTLLFLFLISHRVRARGGSFNEMTRPEWCGPWEERTDHINIFGHIIFMHGPHRQKLYFLLIFLNSSSQSYMRKVLEHYQVFQLQDPRDMTMKKMNNFLYLITMWSILSRVCNTSMIKFIHEQNLHMCCSSRCPGCILICTPVSPPHTTCGSFSSKFHICCFHNSTIWKSYTTEWSTEKASLHSIINCYIDRPWPDFGSLQPPR